MTLPKVLALGHRFDSLQLEREILAEVAHVIDGNALIDLERDSVLAEAVAIMLGTRAELDETTIDMARNCRMIVRYGIGVDNVNVAAATKRGIAVANVPDYCIEEVSNHTIALLLAANRHLIDAIVSTRDGEWHSRMMKGTMRLAAQTVGILAFGRIARAFAYKARSLTDRIIVHDPLVPDSIIAAEGMVPVDFDFLLHESDYISIHCPLTAETRYLFDERALTQMKPTAWLINTARGKIIDEAALATVLQNRPLAGAALDVLEDEPPPPGHPLRALPNVIVTPHVAYYSEQAIEDLQRGAAQQVREVLTGNAPQWPINAPNPCVAK